MMRVEGELHVMQNRNAGHEGSADCWCEPNKIYFARVNGLPGVTKVIEHNDDTAKPHLLVINERERDRALIVLDFRKDYEPAITRALTPPWSPPALPPHDPNLRSL